MFIPFFRKELFPGREMTVEYDVIVVGGGNAALCAAMAARGAGISRPGPRTGAGTHARWKYAAHAQHPLHARRRRSNILGSLFRTGAPGRPDRSHGRAANLDLAKLAVRESSKLPAWMSAHGVNWQQPLAGTLHLGRTNRWFLGGGKALLNTYYQTASRMGIVVRYNARVEELVIENGRFEAVRVKPERARKPFAGAP